MPVATDAPSGWQTIVAATPTSTPPQPTTLVPRDPDAGDKLVLDIQQQLRRVGCYWGRMDGSWGIATKDAMKDFTNRVNAALPLDEPDYVQLALIQSHAELTCGACPAGQSLSASGRCAAPQVATAQKGRVALEGHARSRRGGRTTSLETGGDYGRFYRTAGGTHGDWRPDPDDV